MTQVSLQDRLLILPCRRRAGSSPRGWLGGSAPPPPAQGMEGIHAAEGKWTIRFCGLRVQSNDSTLSFCLRRISGSFHNSAEASSRGAFF